MKDILKDFRKPVTVLALAGAVVLAGSVLAFEPRQPATAEGHGQALNIPLDETPVARSQGSYTSYAPVVKKVGPAVVKVVVAEKANLPDQQGPGFQDPFWGPFFGQRPLPPGHPDRPLQHGLGSGVIVTPDGYILTNNHVVDDAQTVSVTLQDGREFKAKVIGADPKSDIAVIKIDANHLPTVPLADSQKVQIGDNVLAIGNPFGVGQTVTHGIVSATDRGGMGMEDYEDFIQTDAAINPGNSGGALVDVMAGSSGSTPPF